MNFRRAVTVGKINASSFVESSRQRWYRGIAELDKKLIQTLKLFLAKDHGWRRRERGGKEVVRRNRVRARAKKEPVIQDLRESGVARYLLDFTVIPH